MLYDENMIGMLRGTLADKNGPRIVLDVGGVGYSIAVTADTASKIETNAAVTLFTHLAVREDALDLYGFLDRRELSFFQLLIGVPTIGPKTALAILSIADPHILSSAIRKGDPSHLTRVSGIGKKTAEKIVLELREKVGAPLQGSDGAEDEGDVLEALQGLGYSLRQAREAIQATPKEIADPHARIREALKILGKK